MKCPNCDEIIDRNLFLKKDCPLCQQRLYWGINPFIFFIGLLIAVFGGESLSGFLVKSSFLLIGYVFLAGLAVCILPIRIMSKPGLIDLMPYNKIYLVYFFSSSFLIFWIFTQIFFMYINIIPSRQNLTIIEDTFIRSEKLGNSRVYYLLNNGAVRKFYANANYLEKKCPGIEQIEPYSNMKLLVEKSPNFAGYTQIWEMTVDSEVIIPYEIMREIMKKRGKKK